MLKSLSLYDYDLSQLNNIPQNIERLIVHKLNIDIDPSTTNFPMSLKILIIKKVRYSDYLVDEHEILNFTKNIRLPFNCKLYLYTRIDCDAYDFVACYYLSNNLQTHFITKNNFKLQMASNRFYKICQKIKFSL